MRMGLIVRSSFIHAAGCYTTTPIPKGTRVVEYTGPIIDKEEADRRYEDKPITYLFGIGDGSRVIDGHGIAMFINHSCDANCETEEIDERVWIMAIRDIAPGEELCYDYCLYDGDEEEAPCNCGSKNCRGSMYSAEELRRRKRLALKRAKEQSAAKKKKVRPIPKKKKRVRSELSASKPAQPAKTSGRSPLKRKVSQVSSQRKSTTTRKHAKKARAK
ncbi:MAG: SET domain-containing protein-lysine N-methyltransferase [Acidobacteriota bacterium]